MNRSNRSDTREAQQWRHHWKTRSFTLVKEILSLLVSCLLCKQDISFQSTQEKKGQADWTSLPHDMLHEILTRLGRTSSDLVRFGSVCTSWRLVAKQDRRVLHGIVGLLVRGDIETRDQFLSLKKILSRNKNLMMCNLPLVSIPAYLGSYQGWLLLNSPEDDGLTVMNPVTRVKFLLPPLPDPLHKVCFSSTPSSTSLCYVLAICFVKGPRTSVAYCKIGDRAWTDIAAATLPPEETNDYYDAVFHKGKFYVLRRNGGLCVCDISVSPPTMAKLVDRLPPPIQHLQVKSIWYKFYLVEAGGDLLLVYRWCNRGCTLGPGDRKFEVIRLSLDSVWKWNYVQDLGEYALFVGQGQPFALSELEAPDQVKGNCIYFLDDWGTSGNSYFQDCEKGVFSLCTGDFEYFGNYSLPDQRGVWFTFDYPYTRN
ncbi:hypothetical protein Tsubulata_047994 [Turnera subulata]|uniref:F-box domain-containing protein n=1 Tax=Turnera subulata TaxID=218843 RepID=A0A9Q0FE20_9ROSI|nr:hypothetical protein Tsubulata_047994 [Turnera subulata]